MSLSSESLFALLAKTPVLLWWADDGLNLTSASDARVAGVFASPVSRTAHENALRGTGGTFVIECNRRTFEAHVEPVTDESGKITAVSGVAVDISDRLLAERAMRISEHSYRSLVDKAPYGICRVTARGQFLQLNPAMLDMLGYPRDAEGDLLMCDLPQIFVSPERFAACRQALLNEAAVHEFESEWRRLDNRIIFVRIGGRAVRRANGEVLYFDLLVEDITEKKELAARLEQAQKMQMIGQLAGGIAHDFNNLLTIVNGYCDLTIAAAPADMLENLTTIRQAGERAAGLTQQLLALGRQQVTVTQPVQVNTVVREVLGLSRRLISENIRFVEKLEAYTGTVMADAAQMHQMLMNLVINARDAMPAGGTLTIETAPLSVDADRAHRLDVKKGDYAALSVTDTGSGMDDHVRAHIFEPFFTTKAVGKGTGLGLATVYAL
ncbi:MAG: PAS domain S-box protein, partial [Acidobacteriota bacterium]|nr:PAS domain S-box protein [Acidobacteriota bacterium]